MTATWSTVERVDAIGREDFYGEFVAKGKPVVIQNLTKDWRALDWTPEYFRRGGYTTKLGVKMGNVADGRREYVALSDYLESLAKHETQVAEGTVTERPGYLHDVPLFGHFPALKADVDPFPLQLLPEWYRPNWPDYTQHFMGPAGSITPLHFDTLLTNNLFFHLAGRKQFILIPAAQRELCYTHGWRWAGFDPTAPDYDAFPRAAETTPVTVVLEPGEILYMPPGTLHHVTNLSLTMSFNIDWHTAESARLGMASVFSGAPLQNGYYNLVSYLGLGLGVPAKYAFPFYKSYLTYVS
ncbi:cupin-like domain-containing protein [Kribbella sp. NBC_01505]|uniref:cupin-like domain-containing protein n=1 Tax=Kribbella sp. NBC_01505 TaxID=2903580 RepID=UPI003864BDDC